MKIIEGIKNVLKKIFRKGINAVKYIIPVYLLWRMDSAEQGLEAAVKENFPVEFHPVRSRKFDEIIVHCTATPEGRVVTVDDLRHQHVDINGWDDVGYHYVVYSDGTVAEGRPVEKAGAHCRGHNENTIGVAYTGGLLRDGKTPADTRTPEQRKALEELLGKLVKIYGIRKISSHSDYAAKACPCFDASAEYRFLLPR